MPSPVSCARLVDMTTRPKETEMFAVALEEVEPITDEEFAELVRTADQPSEAELEGWYDELPGCVPDFDATGEELAGM